MKEINKALMDSTEILVRTIMGNFCADIVNVLLRNESNIEKAKELQEIFDENKKKTDEILSRMDR